MVISRLRERTTAAGEAENARAYMVADGTEGGAVATATGRAKAGSRAWPSRCHKAMRAKGMIRGRPRPHQWPRWKRR